MSSIDRRRYLTKDRNILCISEIVSRLRIPLIVPLRGNGLK